MSLETFGRYELLRKIATGGMAQIYFARETLPDGSHRHVVVKRILPHMAENEDFIRMFLDEARIAARLNHPNVVQIHDLGSEADSFFLSMEFIHGDDLRRLWKHSEEMGKPLPIELVCRIIADCAAGLDYAHKKTDAQGKALDIVHRDISPQNILVAFDGTVKVVDFGIAKAADQSTVTASGVLKGKYSYMSPEQAAVKKRPIDRRTDIFALGIVLYELLTGTRLFKRSTDIQTLNAVTECKVHPPSEVNLALPDDLDAIVMKALEKEPQDRYQDAKALQQALEDWLATRKAPSSQAALSAFMKDVYADRLAQEAKEGELPVPASPSSDNIQGVPAIAVTPAKRPPRIIKSAKVPQYVPPPKVTVTAEQTLTERPPTRKEQDEDLSQVTVDDRAGPATNTFKARGGKKSSSRWLALVGIATVLALALAALWVFNSRVTTSVTLQSTPAGANLVFDGTPLKCRTPCKLPARRPGKYPLELSLTGFETLKTSVDVTDQKDQSTTLTLTAAEEIVPPVEKPKTVMVSFRSEPAGATVSIDGITRGVTPVEVELLARADVQVHLEHDGFTPSDERVRVGADANESHAYELTPIPVPEQVSPAPAGKATGGVRFFATPWAEVECPPIKLGRTPTAERQFPVGEYTCIFSHPQHTAQRRTVKVTAGSHLRVTTTFEVQPFQ